MQVNRLAIFALTKRAEDVIEIGEEGSNSIFHEFNAGFNAG